MSLQVIKTLNRPSQSLCRIMKMSHRNIIKLPLRQSSNSRYPSPKLELPPIVLNTEFLLNPDNKEAIRNNIKARLSDADIDKIHELAAAGNQQEQLAAAECQQADQQEQLLAELVKCPNMSHPKVANLSEPAIVFQRDFVPPDHKIRSFEEIARILGGAKFNNLKPFTGERSYYLTGVLAELEQALIQWAVSQLEEKGFQLISVPDILHSDIIRRCGMNVDGERTQVYRLDPRFGDAALSGTAEMAIGGFLMGKQLTDLPLKICAVSRCYRAEAAQNVQDKGLYRVHQFYKVEMFMVTEGKTEASQEALHEILAIEQQMFDSLGLAYKVLDMSPDELGDPAARKYDVEAWMPGRNFWGEISSCSDCTDFQARRLNITDSNGRFCHTVNGTACAVPRMILALCEQHQTLNGSVAVPAPLRKFLRGNPDVLAGKPKKQRATLMYVNSANYFDNQNVARE
eukprot:TRINITY_DN3577_c0_g1_i4.p1 TRINITY_DN3577_c0_g1~~TRINITY_DN3577_c0_g1_i4.p1  ORF type:complete len:457 (-),score=75.41 TRINITY_DN3577_c0_g1_i4:86-1456(-)